MSWDPWSTSNFSNLAKYILPEHSGSIAKLYLQQSTLSAHMHGSEGRRALIRSLYNEIRFREQPIKYNFEPLHWNRSQQKIRTPSEILVSPGEGTCLDLALLFSGLSILYELIPIVVLIENDSVQHVVVMISLAHSIRDKWDSGHRSNFLEKGFIEDKTTILELIEDGLYLPLECTGFSRVDQTLPGLEGQGRTESGFLDFERAVQVGMEQIQTLDLRTALDVYALVQKFGETPFVLKEPEYNGEELAQVLLTGIQVNSEVLLEQIRSVFTEHDTTTLFLLDEIRKDRNKLTQFMEPLLESLTKKLDEDRDNYDKLANLVQGSGIQVNGNNVVLAVGNNARALGAGAVAVDGDVTGPIITGDNNQVGD